MFPDAYSKKVGVTVCEQSSDLCLAMGAKRVPSLVWTKIEMLIMKPFGLSV